MICLSFDTDHLDEARMAEFTAEVPLPGACTFFCTQRYEGLDPSAHELCAHPDLRPGVQWGEELDRARADFPDAVGFRGHAAPSSHALSMELQSRGYEWTSAREEPGRPNVAPFREAWGIWHAPVFYMDNMDFSFADFWPGVEHTPFDRTLLETAVGGAGTYVFDFHPIHLLLNSRSAPAYLERREAFLAGEALSELRFDGYGAWDFYGDLLALMTEAGESSVTISDAVATAAGESASPARRA